MPEITPQEIQTLREAAGYLDGTTHHYGTLKRDALTRDLRKLAEKLEKAT